MHIVPYPNIYRHTKFTGQFADKPTCELVTRRQRIGKTTLYSIIKSNNDPSPNLTEYYQRRQLTGNHTLIAVIY